MNRRIRPETLPVGALLATYDQPGSYVDCLAASLPRTVSLPQLINAFYGSRAFRLERAMIGVALGRKAGDHEVQRLASAKSDQFSAWSVEARTHDQILLCDFRGATRSWLMVEAEGGGTTIRFGSAVVDAAGPGFRLLLGFHRLYARLLLGSALRALG